MRCQASLAVAAAAALLAGWASTVEASHGVLICLAGGPYVTDCAGPDAAVKLDGSASRDPSGHPITYSWITDCPGGKFDNPILPQPVLTVPAAPGCRRICEVELTVDNRMGKVDDCHASIVVEDTTPPGFAPAPPGPILLWPPNHRRECYSIEDLPGAAASDACNDPSSVKLSGCRVSEPAAPGACTVAADGRSVCVVAERNGRGTGRSYEILASAEDACGNVSAPAVVATVSVPHDLGR